MDSKLGGFNSRMIIIENSVLSIWDDEIWEGLDEEDKRKLKKEFYEYEKKVIGLSFSFFTWSNNYFEEIEERIKEYYENPVIGKYEGEIKNGLPNGQRTKTWSSGSKYVGSWKDGKENGQGTFTSSDENLKKQSE